MKIHKGGYTSMTEDTLFNTFYAGIRVCLDCGCQYEPESFADYHILNDGNVYAVCPECGKMVYLWAKKGREDKFIRAYWSAEKRAKVNGEDWGTPPRKKKNIFKLMFGL